MTRDTRTCHRMISAESIGPGLVKRIGTLSLAASYTAATNPRPVTY